MGAADRSPTGVRKSTNLRTESRHSSGLRESAGYARNGRLAEAEDSVVIQASHEKSLVKIEIPCEGRSKDPNFRPNSQKS
jgi:hypothetical protein